MAPVAARFYGNPSICRELEAAKGSREILPVILLVKFEKGHGIRGRPHGSDNKDGEKQSPYGEKIHHKPTDGEGAPGKVIVGSDCCSEC